MENQDQIQPINNPPETPQTVPPSQPSGKSWKKFLLFAILILLIPFIIVFIGGVISGFFGLSMGGPLALPTLPPTSVTPIPPWKTYTNAKYGYSIMIPSTMQYNFEENVDKDPKVGRQSLDVLSAHAGQPLERGGYAGPEFSIDIFPEKGNETWQNEKAPSDTESTAVIDGVTLKKLVGLSGVRIGPLKKDGYIFLFTAEREHEKEIEKIFSTFKFNTLK